MCVPNSMFDYFSALFCINSVFVLTYCSVPGLTGTSSTTAKAEVCVNMDRISLFTNFI